jgi:hypothetical protein
VRVTLGTDENVLTKVTIVEAPASVVEEPCFMLYDGVVIVEVDEEPLVVSVTAEPFEYIPTLLKFNPVYISIYGLVGVKLLNASA